MPERGADAVEVASEPRRGSRFCLISLAFVMIAVAACAPGGRGEAPESSAEYSAQSGDSAGVDEVSLRFDGAAEVGGLVLRWLEVADSRCPRGFTCVWEGEVTVTLLVEGGGEAGREIELSLRPGKGGAGVTVGGRELRLVTVDPAPIAGRRTSEEDLVAVIRVASPDEASSGEIGAGGRKKRSTV